MVRLAGGKSDMSIMRYLDGVQFPVHKDVIIHTARHNGAPNDVIDALQQLPANEYASPEELIEAYPHLD